MRQLGEATLDVMHPFFMKKAGFNLEELLPQYVHEYATLLNRSMLLEGPRWEQAKMSSRSALYIGC